MPPRRAGTRFPSQSRQYARPGPRARRGCHGGIPRCTRSPRLPRPIHSGPAVPGTWHARMKSKSLVRLGALAVLWGSGFLFIKEALGGVGPFHILFGRLLAADVVMVAVTLVAKRELPTYP